MHLPAIQFWPMLSELERYKLPGQYFWRIRMHCSLCVEISHGTPSKAKLYSLRNESRTTTYEVNSPA